MSNTNAAFEALKKASKNSITSLVAEAEKMSGGQKSYDDERIWKPTRDKSGNAFAVIRFLPSAKVTEGGVPWVRYWDHGFQGPTGRWYIEKSLTSIGLDDPVSKVNSALWNSGVESDKEVARKQKRRLHYVSNILVIQDSANPENEGKVMLYKFGAKVFDKLMSAMQPEFEDEEAINPFDFWKGANFKLKIRQVEGWPNYDKSEFDSASVLFEGDEDKISEVFENLHDVDDFTDPKNYKSYAELETKLKLVLGEESVTSEPVADYTPDNSDESAIGNSMPDIAEEPKTDSSDEDDDISFFTKMAKDD